MGQNKIYHPCLFIAEKYINQQHRLYTEISETITTITKSTNYTKKSFYCIVCTELQLGLRKKKHLYTIKELGRMMTNHREHSKDIFWKC